MFKATMPTLFEGRPSNATILAIGGLALATIAATFGGLMLFAGEWISPLVLVASALSVLSVLFMYAGIAGLASPVIGLIGAAMFALAEVVMPLTGPGWVGAGIYGWSIFMAGAHLILLATALLVRFRRTTAKRP